jgi:hypothetical protein
MSARCRLICAISQPAWASDMGQAPALDDAATSTHAAAHDAGGRSALRSCQMLCVDKMACALQVRPQAAESESTIVSRSTVVVPAARFPDP